MFRVAVSSQIASSSPTSSSSSSPTVPQSIDISPTQLIKIIHVEASGGRQQDANPTAGDCLSHCLQDNEAMLYVESTTILEDLRTIVYDENRDNIEEEESIVVQHAKTIIQMCGRAKLPLEIDRCVRVKYEDGWHKGTVIEGDVDKNGVKEINIINFDAGDDIIQLEMVSVGWDDYDDWEYI